MPETRRYSLKQTKHRAGVLALAAFMAGFSAVWAQTAGSSPSEAAPPGTTVSGIVECGEGYTSHELYDMRITLLEVVRGDEAWKLVRDASPSNKPPTPGTDYVLARVRFEYYARGTPGLCVHPLAADQFTAYSASGEGYPAATVVPPNPQMHKDLKSGESCEGWLVFAVPKEDKAPIMLYSANPGGAVQHGGGKWFLLK
jgi:hypothetical protein